VNVARGAAVLSRIEITEVELLSKQLEMLKLHFGKLRGDGAVADER